VWSRSLFDEPGELVDLTFDVDKLPRLAYRRGYQSRMVLRKLAAMAAVCMLSGCGTSTAHRAAADPATITPPATRLASAAMTSLETAIPGPSLWIVTPVALCTTKLRVTASDGR
jgi:hypothetical protein